MDGRGNEATPALGSPTDSDDLTKERRGFVRMMQLGRRVRYVIRSDQIYMIVEFQHTDVGRNVFGIVAAMTCSALRVRSWWPITALASSGMSI